MTGYPPPSYPPPSPYPPPYPQHGGAAYLPGVGYGAVYSKPTDVLGRRIGAYAIDLAIGLVIFFVMFFALASTQSFDTSSQATDFCDRLNDDPDFLCTASGTSAYIIDSTELAAIFLAETGFFVVNFVLLTGLTGFSLGKLMTGVRVVNQNTGHRCGIGRALLRTVLLVVPDLGGLVGVIVAATNSEKRRVGDMAAGTLVVHKRALGQPPVTQAPYVYSPGVPGYPPGYGYPPPAPSWPGGGAPPPPPWAAPTPPPPPAAPPATPVERWPDFGHPSADPDATTVFDTSTPTDRHDVVDEPAKAGAPPQPLKDTAPASAKPDTAPAGERRAEPVKAAADAGATSAEGEARPGVGAPHWDTTRNTYIQWDPELAAWMQWDYAKNEWQPMK